MAHLMVLNLTHFSDVESHIRTWNGRKNWPSNWKLKYFRLNKKGKFLALICCSWMSGLPILIK